MVRLESTNNLGLDSKMVCKGKAIVMGQGNTANFVVGRRVTLLSWGIAVLQFVHGEVEGGAIMAMDLEENLNGNVKNIKNIHWTYFPSPRRTWSLPILCALTVPFRRTNLMMSIGNDITHQVPKPSVCSRNTAVQRIEFPEARAQYTGVKIQRSYGLACRVWHRHCSLTPYGYAAQFTRTE